MINSISNVTQAEPVAQTQGTSAQTPTQPEPHLGVNPDSVQLSRAAQTTLAALKETRETTFQTANEAGHGDLQAQRLLAKEAAEKSVTE